MIYDPKEREVQAIGYRDRVMQHLICDNYLQPLLDKKLIYYNVACRKGKGTALAIKALRKFMTEHYKKNGTGGYFIKADIKKYFGYLSAGNGFFLYLQIEGKLNVYKKITEKDGGDCLRPFLLSKINRQK